jgi:transposase
MILPLHKRYEIAFLHHHRKGPKLSYRDIAKIVNCSVDTVSFWANVWLETKDLSSEPGTGRKRSTTTEDDKKIVKLAKNDNNATSFTIQQEMSRGGLKLVHEPLDVALERLEENTTNQFANHCFRTVIWRSGSSGQGNM